MELQHSIVKTVQIYEEGAGMGAHCIQSGGFRVCLAEDVLLRAQLQLQLHKQKRAAGSLEIAYLDVVNHGVRVFVIHWGGLSLQVSLGYDAVCAY